MKARHNLLNATHIFQTIQYLFIVQRPYCENIHLKNKKLDFVFSVDLTCTTKSHLRTYTQD